MTRAHKMERHVVRSGFGVTLERVKIVDANGRLVDNRYELSSPRLAETKTFEIPTMALLAFDIEHGHFDR